MNKAVTAKPGELNLCEMITRYPKKGLGMKVWRKTWDEKNYWLIYRVYMVGPKNARLFGLKYQGETLISDKVERIKGVNKRGIW